MDSICGSLVCHADDDDGVIERQDAFIYVNGILIGGTQRELATPNEPTIKPLDDWEEVREALDEDLRSYCLSGREECLWDTICTVSCHTLSREARSWLKTTMPIWIS